MSLRIAWRSGAGPEEGAVDCPGARCAKTQQQATTSAKETFFMMTSFVPKTRAIRGVYMVNADAIDICAT